MRKTIFNYLCGAALVCAAAGAHAQADHLLLSEVGMAPSAQVDGFSSEYVEIYNPTSNAVPLDNYYISDHNSYKLFPVNETVAGGNTDNILQFPPGYVLQPGQYAVVTGGGNNFLDAFFGVNVTHDDFRSLPGQPLLFEVGETDDEIPNMSYYNTGGTPSNFNLTNPSATNGEFIVLFYWDRASDLVQDVDLVTWGNPSVGSDPLTSNRFVPKTASDTGRNGTPYLPDAGDHANLSVGNTGYQLINRVSFTETGEVLTGGNGITGNDESTENAPATWVGGSFGRDESPGYAHEVLLSERPVISGAVRDVQYPAPGQDITITTEVSDPDGTVEDVVIYVRTDATFTGVNATEAEPGVWSANIGSFANDTVVDYYVEATDDTGMTQVFPQSAPMSGQLQGFHVTDSPVAEGDVIINEIFYDNPGPDAWEFVELYNMTDQPVDLSYFVFRDPTNNPGMLPRGAVLPPNGYMVITLDTAELLQNFPRVPGVSYYDWGTFQLNQSGDTIYLIHANEVGTANDPAFTAIEEVTYGTFAPWPTDFGGSLRSLELKHPSLDNTLPGSWAESIDMATPGEQNSVYSAGPVIGGVSRDVEFPDVNSPIVISAEITHATGGTIASAQVMVDTNNSGTFTPVAMTESSTPGVFTATLPGYADDTVVRYYVEAEDNLGVSVTNPLTAPAGTRMFLVDANPPVPGDLVINEILYDNIGSDTYEYVEIYNNTDEEISLAYLRLGDDTINHLEFPADAVIAPRGYVIGTMNISNLTMQYTIPPDVPMYEVPYTLNNDGDLVYIAHPNSVNFNGTTTYIDEVRYTTEAPWPAIDANATGQSIELLHPDLDNSQGENWAGAVIIGPFPGSGTPGAQNSVHSSVADWNLY